MAFLESGHIYSAAVRWRYGTGDDQVNVWHFECVGDVAPTEAEQRADLEEALVDLYGLVPSFMSDQLTHLDVTVFDITASAPTVGLGAISDLDGTNSNEALPSGVSAFLYAKTNRSHTIGRKFLPTFVRNYVVSGVWTSTVTDELVLMGNRWRLGFVAANETELQFGVYGAAGGWRTPISTAYSIVPAYQRRRRFGAGS